MRSTLQVCTIPGARALSPDGVHWELQVLGDYPNTLWGGYAEHQHRVYFRFGDWSRKNGLDRVPINPILNNAQLIPTAQQMLEVLQKRLPPLPFPTADPWEYWRLDEKGRPLVMLGSSAQPYERIPADRTDWLAWEEPGKQERTDRHADWGPPAEIVRIGSELQDRLASIQGRDAHGSWYRRSSCGAAQNPGTPPEKTGTRGSSDELPQLPWTTRFDAPGLRELVDRYTHWQAPWLLTLPGIDDALREELERRAAKNAPVVAQLWRIYPKVIDPERLEAALVEARLRASSARPGDPR